MDKRIQMWWINLYRDFNLTWNIFVVQLVVLSLCTCANSILSLELPAVHWNSSNPMFKTSNNDHIIEVNLYDEMDFVCPFYDDDVENRDYHEYYIIHWVSKREYDDCNLYEADNPVAIINCHNPRRKLRFTMIFDPYLAIPGSPAFIAGGTYYFITTSTGRAGQEEIENPTQGACWYRNMKVTIQVCCESTTNATTERTTPPATPLPTTHTATQSSTSAVPSTMQTSSTVASTPESTSTTTVSSTPTTTFIRWWRFSSTTPVSNSNEVNTVFSSTTQQSSAENENEAYSSGAIKRQSHKLSVLFYSLIGGLISVRALTKHSAYEMTLFAIITSSLYMTSSVTFLLTTVTGS